MNKEQLKEAVGELNLVDTVFEADGVSYIDTAVSVMQVYDLIDQLDEPEVLSHKWISDHITFNEKEDAEYIYADELQNLLVPKQESEVLPEDIMETITRAFDVETTANTIEMLSGMTIEQVAEGFRDGNLVPKQELPVIPKHVDQWIIRHREKFDLYPALRKLENNTSGWERTYKWYRKNTHTFVNAYLTGRYEVAEEQKYYVLDKQGRTLLMLMGGEVCASGGYILSESAFTKDTYQLTEKEIKDYDERYWPFAVPVEVQGC